MEPNDFERPPPICPIASTWEPSGHVQHGKDDRDFSSRMSVLPVAPSWTDALLRLTSFCLQVLPGQKSRSGQSTF